MKKQENIAKIYPLTPLQEGMLFHAVTDTGSSAYCLQMSATIEGDFHLPLFEQSLNKLVENHEVLRTAFVYQNMQRPRVQGKKSDRSLRKHHAFAKPRAGRVHTSVHEATSYLRPDKRQLDESSHFSNGREQVPIGLGLPSYYRGRLDIGRLAA